MDDNDRRQRVSTSVIWTPDQPEDGRPPGGGTYRARAINADPALLLSVHRLRVFGSYLRDDVDPLGDVDVELVIARRLPSSVYVAAARAYADASGRSFGNSTSYLGWPETELRMKLKNRSTALNITLEDIDDLTDQVRVVYDIEHDPDALPVNGDILYRG